MLRQIAFLASVGINPFTMQDMPQRRVLLIDLENGELELQDGLQRIAPFVGRDVSDEWFFPVNQPQGLYLDIEEDFALLKQWVVEAAPHIVAIGPFYKLVAGDLNDDFAVREAFRRLDRLRAAHGFSIILEGHTTHEGAKADGRPTGSRAQPRWPEFGMFLKPNGSGATEYELRDWRGARELCSS